MNTGFIGYICKDAKMSVREEAFEDGNAKIPTGVGSIDLAVSGGLPSGSLVVLFGRTGSGREAFIHTSAFMNAARKKGILNVSDYEDVYLPDNILYILLSKTKNDIIRDVSVAYSDDLVKAFKDMVEFEDLMSDYYTSTLSSLESPDESLSDEEGEEAIEIVRSIIDYLNEKGQNSLIFIDSLDDLIRAFPSGEERDLLTSLRTIRSKNREKWNSLVLTRLSGGIFPENVENSILSLSDGVFNFKSITSGGSRTRKMSCDKFSGVTSSDLLNSTFEFDVTNSGLEAKRTFLLDT